ANNNGIISFKDKLTSYKPHNFNSAIFQNEVPLVAPYWADVDIENVKGLNETIVYRLVDNERSDSAILNRASRDVRKYFKGDGDFSAKIVLIVTWYQVGFYGATLTGKSKRNTFQTVLITDGQHSYAIFNYNNITWTTGSNSGGDETTGLSGSGGEPAV
ncbi:TECTA-like protein, partial [Mya arenaria]